MYIHKCLRVRRQPLRLIHPTTKPPTIAVPPAAITMPSNMMTCKQGHQPPVKALQLRSSTVYCSVPTPAPVVAHNWQQPQRTAQLPVGSLHNVHRGYQSSTNNWNVHHTVDEPGERHGGHLSLSSPGMAAISSNCTTASTALPARPLSPLLSPLRHLCKSAISIVQSAARLIRLPGQSHLMSAQLG